MLLLYNILFPLAFLFFIPGMICKLIRRPGYKKTFLERFAIYSEETIARLKENHGSVWIHSVSVGETVLALSMIRRWQESAPDRKFVLSTTTTTGQALARDKAPEGVTVIYCQIDFIFFVRKAFSLIRPEILIIFETEIWPNMINLASKRCKKAVLVNARMSDKSVKGYVKFRSFFSPILNKFNFVCVQTESDMERFKTVAPELKTEVCGNMKFDQKMPLNLKEIDLSDCFGNEERLTILAASTHPGEEKLIAETCLNLKEKFHNLKLILLPRHAERGNEISSELKTLGIKFHRRTSKEPPKGNEDCLLADTTGEMLSFINLSDIVIMGKSLAGQDEGHNLIEPAMLEKPIVTGAVLKNFRFVLNALKEKDALITVENDPGLEIALNRLLNDADLRHELGKRAKSAISSHEGATDKTIKLLEELLCKK
jgi:3-deoxy-D-manno-octulosonic-acid transferase